MSNPTLILGIESSCDETAAAIVADGRTILSNVVASQFDLHRPFGGVVPEVAARAHCERVTALVDEALVAAGVAFDSPHNPLPTLHCVSAVSVVHRPGLVGALLVGMSAAKALALAWDVPLIGIDHILGHVYAPALAGFARYPHVSLIVSGGHTCLYRVTSPTEIETLGQTCDDAAGEAFDKVATMLGLGFPGGPALAKAAESVPDSERQIFRDVVNASRTHAGEAENPLDFSFSGLKTAVYYHLRGTTRGRGALRAISDDERRAVAASFEEAACAIMAGKALAACRQEKIAALAVSGGVACNARLRAMLTERAARERNAIEVFFPPPSLCTDNAAMSAGLAYHYYTSGKFSGLDLEVDATPKRAR
ncbi:MAG TPA: tRNA (adenosine(37)-N6)-threonylcarbamoyltransferase complex transferase subunit TsaD [Planctomycetota bacterium]|nr:tRNA (adenosine(37)-N6)-threonylcarbamoyltransferase complex transferase subunit TsaD [Planctomycetota bacterium]